MSNLKHTIRLIGLAAVPLLLSDAVSMWGLFSLAKGAPENHGSIIWGVMVSLIAITTATLLLVWLCGDVFTKRITEPVQILAYKAARTDGRNRLTIEIWVERQKMCRKRKENGYF